MENLPPGEGSGASDIAGQSSDSTLLLNIKTLDSRIFNFNVDKSISVSDFKEHIASQVGVPVGQQRLIFRGKVLKDDHRLSEYNVEHGDTLHLVERQPQPPPMPNTGDTTSSGSTGGLDPSAGGPRSRIGQIAHSVVLGTLNVGESGPGEAPVPDLSRVIGAVLSSIGIGSLAGGTQPGVQNPNGNETEQSQAQANAGSQGLGGIQFGPFQAGQSGSIPMQNRVGVAIPVPTLNMPIPDSLNTLTEFMNRMELALSQNDTQQNQSPTASGSVPTPEMPVNSLGFPNVEALTTVLRHAQRLLSDHVVPTLSQTAARLDQEGGSSDPAVRGQVQIESVHLGVAMQHLGALLLELGRTILTLRIRQSPGESFVNAGPAVYISPSGPNPIMVQPFPLQTSPLFGGSPGVTQNHVPVGPFGSVTRNVNIHIHTGASLAPIVPVLGNTAPSGEETRGQRVTGTPDLSSVSSTVAQINAQLRNLAANMQNGNQAPLGGSANQGQPAGGGVSDNETTQTSGMDNQKAKNDTSTGPNGGSHNRSSTSGQAESLEGPSGSSQSDSNQDGSSGVPLGLGLGGLQPKRRVSQPRPQANNSDGASSSTAVGQQVLQSLASLSSRGGATPPSSRQLSLPARGTLGNMPTARQNTNSDNIDMADAMSQALDNSSLDGLLAGVSQQTGVGSPDMLRNMLQQFTQNPAMRNSMNQIAQQFDGQDLGSVFSGGGGQGGGGFDLSRMMQQMMPIVSQVLGGMPQQNAPPGPGQGLLENISRRDVGSNDNSQIDLRQVVQRLEQQSSSEDIFRSVVNGAVQLSNSEESLVNALCFNALAQEFMDMLLLDLSGRLEDEM